MCQASPRPAEPPVCQLCLRELEETSQEEDQSAGVQCEADESSVALACGKPCLVEARMTGLAR